MAAPGRQGAGCFAGVVGAAGAGVGVGGAVIVGVRRPPPSRCSSPSEEGAAFFVDGVTVVGVLDTRQEGRAEVVEVVGLAAQEPRREGEPRRVARQGRRRQRRGRAVVVPPPGPPRWPPDLAAGVPPPAAAPAIVVAAPRDGRAHAGIAIAMMAMVGVGLPLQHVQEVGCANRRDAGAGGSAIVALLMPPPPPPRGDDGLVLDALEEEDVVGVHGRGTARADASADADASIVAAVVMIDVAVAVVVALALHFWGVL